MKINLVLDRSSNYALVQRTLLDSICRHLQRENWTTSIGTYRAGCVNFALFVRQPADVVMSHGVADKNYFTDIRDDRGVLFANRLRGLLVPGPWLKRKLLAFPELQLREHQIHTVGWPRLDLLRQLAPAPRGERLRVLWAPTHDFRKQGAEQLSTSSYPGFEPYLAALRERFEVAVSLHPRNRAAKAPTDAPLVDADVIISDFGTMVYEAWALGKPVIFPRWLLGDRIQKYLPGSAEAHIFERRIGYHPGSFEELLEVVRAGPVITPEVEAFMTDYLDDDRRGSSGARIAGLLSAMARQGF